MNLLIFSFKTQNSNTSTSKFLYKEINNFENLFFLFLYSRLYSENEQKIFTWFITFNFVVIFRFDWLTSLKMVIFVDTIYHCFQIKVKCFSCTIQNSDPQITACYFFENILLQSVRVKRKRYLNGIKYILIH